HRIVGDPHVPVVRRGDHDRIDIRFCKHLTIVARCKQLLPQISLARASRPSYRSATATSSVPGTFNASRVAPIPCPPAPMSPNRILSLGAIRSGARSSWAARTVVDVEATRLAAVVSLMKSRREVFPVGSILNLLLVIDSLSCPSVESLLLSWCSDS